MTVRTLVCGLLALCCSTLASAADDWLLYRQRFIDNGRVVDTGNGRISHSEGQGYGMLLALNYDDRQTFEALWSWSRKNLGRHDLPLFAWKYDPAAKPPVADNNDAADGDILIAWALLEAGKRWNNSNYLNASRRIRAAVAEQLVQPYAGYTLLLPGLKGFAGNGYVDINLSYWVMPAIAAFAAADQEPRWTALLQSGEKLLQQAQFGDAALPSDWIRITSQGKLAPSPDWPTRFSFDAVRIPLYFYWAGLGGSDALAAIKRFWRVAGEQPPAWLDVHSGEQAPYSISTGVKAINRLGQKTPLPQWDEQADYYSASLLLLSRMAAGTR